MKAQETSKNQCHCGRSFIRKEHLTRHQATHGKPSHVCLICQRSFTRGDLLRRHATIHDAPGSGGPQRPKACDFCHYSKVKCDGRDRCSQCGKRGIACTYTRGEGVVQQTRPEVPGDAPVGEGIELDVTSDTESMDHLMHTQEDGRSRKDTDLGLYTLLNLIKSNPSLPMHMELPAELEAIEAWWLACHKVYQDRFHDHWPVVHDPSWEGMGYTVRTGACVAMIASWSGHQQDAESDKLVLRIHQHFMLSLTQELMNPSEDGVVWPFESWALVLCNVVFALNSGRQALILPAQRLFAMLVEDCRSKRVFSADAIKRQTEIHHPGTFQPWVYVHCEQYSRLAVAMFKLDTYLSLLYGRPPLIRRDEIDVELPMPLTLWNAHGLDVYFKRLPRGTEDRKVYRMAMFMRCPYRSLSPTLLYEDVQLLLCGVAQAAWQMSRVRAEDDEIKTPEDNARSADALTRLRVLQGDLNRLDRIIREPNSNTEGYEYLLWSYMTTEAPEDTDWKTRVLGRISSLRYSARMLFHLINMRIYADVDLLWRLNGARDSENDRLVNWARSTDGRKALLHAVETLLLSEESSHPSSCEPVSKIAITTAALVLQAYLSEMKADETDQLTAPDGQYVEVSLELLSGGDKPGSRQARQWLNEGTGTASFSGLPLTGRMAHTWLARVSVSLQAVKSVWPLSEKVAALPTQN